jgi:hypothetical protein
MSEDNPYIDTIESAEELLFGEIDETQNLLGNRWLERGTFATLIGSSGIGKSVAAMQIAILAAAGLPVFGIKPPRPLAVMLIQSEDSLNDRKMQVKCIWDLYPTEELRDLVFKNLAIYTTDRRGIILFNHLKQHLPEPDEAGNTTCPYELFVINPAFAFFDEGASVEESKDVGFFLRSELQPFLKRMGAAGLVVHHTPKLTHRDTTKWSTQTFMHSGHGSAEWTNAPRGVITIDGTNSPNVFEFRIAKRGYHSGWAPNSKGEFLKYFSHSPPGTHMHWMPSSEEDIAAAQQESGLKDRDVMDLFSVAEPEITRETILSRLQINGLKFDEKEINNIFKRLLNKNSLHQVGQSFVLAKIVKEMNKATQAEQRSTEKAEHEMREREEVFQRIENMMPDGIIIGDLTKKGAFSFGRRKIENYLNELVDQGRIRLDITNNGIIKMHRYLVIS